MRTRITYVVTIILSLAAGIMGTIMVMNNEPNNQEVETVVKNVTITENDTIKPAIDKIYDSVFLIESYKGDSINGTGTGFVYKKDDKSGYIITNHHVISDSTSIKVLSINGDRYDAKLLGSDAYADIAVLSIDKDAVLKVAEIGESTLLEIGDTLFTVGSPLGAEYLGTVTKGILSGKDRTVSVQLPHGNFMLDLIQTDAAINPGNSGGPLVNINGKVIGVNSLKLVKDEIEGMGFAIPIEIVMSSVDRLEKGEEIKRPLLGIEIIDATDTYDLFRNKITLDKKFDHGIALIKVNKNMPADLAGLKDNDVILEINNIKIKGIGHFRFLLYKYDVGDTVTVKYYRSGKVHEAKLKLTESVE